MTPPYPAEGLDRVNPYQSGFSPFSATDPLYRFFGMMVLL